MRDVLAELVDQHAPPHRLDAARFQVEQLEGAERDADQAVHGEAQVVQDGAHLAVLALAQADVEPHVAALHLVEGGLDGAVADAIDLDAVLELVQRLLGDGAVGPDPVAAQPSGSRQLQVPRQGAVVGKEEKALGVHVETANRNHTGQMLRQRLEHGLASLRVPVRGDEAFRLVIAPQPRRLGRGQLLAVDQDAVAWAYVAGRARQHLAVDAHPALRDPPLGLPARAQPRPRQRLGDADGLRRSGRCSSRWPA